MNYLVSQKLLAPSGCHTWELKDNFHDDGNIFHRLSERERYNIWKL